MSRIVLQRIVFPVGIVMPAAMDAMLPLYVNEEQSQAWELDGRHSVRIHPGGSVNLDAYFNRLHAGYWSRFTDLDSVTLSLTFEGSGHLAVLRSTPDGRELHTHSEDLTGDGTYEVVLSLAELAAGGTLWAQLVAGPEGLVLLDGSWTVDQEPVRDVLVDFAICTFQRPEDVVGCLTGLASSTELQAVTNRVWLVDNGTKSFRDAPGGEAAAAMWGDKLSVVQQQNLGGSGGFSRGMYEAMNGGVASHVFLLDDDVVVEPEGLRRAIVMASLTPQPTLVGAHMLERLRPTTLWTTGEVLDPLSFAITASDAEAGYRIDLEEYRQESVVTSAFNGWWSCLIPIEAVERVGMSLPFFIKWDDIEYGYRAAEAGYPTITLPGAAVWHESWDTKDDVDNWTLYFTVRNRLIHTAMESARLKPADRQKRARSVLVTIIRHDLLVFLSRRMYANASAVVAALNDFASGTLVLEEKSLTEQVAQVRAARKGFPDIPVSFPTDRLQALDGYVEPKSRRKALTLPLAIGSELVAGEPDDQWRLRRTIRTAVDIGAVGNVGLEVLPKANDRWWSILDRDDVYVSTIDGKAMSRRRRDSKLTRKLLAEGLSAARKAQKAIVENSADWASKREMLCSPEWWAKAFEQAEVPAEPNRGQQ